MFRSAGDAFPKIQKTSLELPLFTIVGWCLLSLFYLLFVNETLKTNISWMSQ